MTSPDSRDFPQFFRWMMSWSIHLQRAPCRMMPHRTATDVRFVPFSVWRNSTRVFSSTDSASFFCMSRKHWIVVANTRLVDLNLILFDPPTSNGGFPRIEVMQRQIGQWPFCPMKTCQFWVRTWGSLLMFPAGNHWQSPVQKVRSFGGHSPKGPDRVSIRLSLWELHISRLEPYCLTCLGFAWNCDVLLKICII